MPTEGTVIRGYFEQWCHEGETTFGNGRIPNKSNAILTNMFQQWKSRMDNKMENQKEIEEAARKKARIVAEFSSCGHLEQVEKLAAMTKALHERVQRQYSLLMTILSDFCSDYI